MQKRKQTRTKPLLSAGILLLFLLTGAVWAAPTLQNGDFSNGLEGWDVEFGTVTDGGGFAYFQEDDWDASSTLSQTFTLPDLALELSFDVWMESVPGGPDDPWAWPDEFTASLLDPDTFDPLIANPGYTEFFYLDNTGVVETVATYVGNTVTLDVSGLAGQNVFLAFDLWGGYDGMNTTVGVDNVSVSVIPAPGALLLAGIGTCIVGKLRRMKKL